MLSYTDGAEIYNRALTPEEAARKATEIDLYKWKGLVSYSNPTSIDQTMKVACFIEKACDVELVIYDERGSRINALKGRAEREGMWMKRRECVVVVMTLVLVLLMGGKTLAENRVVPKVGVYITEDDILRARERAKTQKWAKDMANHIIKEADEWVSYPDEWYYDIMPEQGSIFAYGQDGCPDHDISWASFGRAGIASFDRPDILRCPGGHDIDFDNPSSKYYDPGDGVDINGTRYYFRGVWNSFIVNQLIGGLVLSEAAVDYLVYAYVLTGDAKYAHKALVILDAVATLSATTIGPRDFSSPGQIAGRLHHYTSIVNRTRMKYVRNYDLLYNFHETKNISPTNPTNYGKTEDFTIIENIEENLIKDYLFEQYDPRGGKLVSLHNHEADAVRSFLAAGLVLGEPEWIRWAMHEVSLFLDNTIDRDGMYYETSLSYSSFARSVFMDMAEVAWHYDPEKYQGEGFPSLEELPYGGNFFNNPRLWKLVFGHRDRIDAAGRIPAYGDCGPDLNRVNAKERQVQSNEWKQVQNFYSRTTEEDWKEVMGYWLMKVSDEKPDKYRDNIWSLFHGPDLPGLNEYPGDIEQRLAGIVTPKDVSSFLGGTGLAILRSASNPERALVLRGGPNLAHGHDDLLALNFYTGGYEITGDIGYGISGSHVNSGWGRQSISHNLVVVDKASRRIHRYFQIGPGSDTHGFFDAGWLSFVDMDGASHYNATDSQIKTYRRGIFHVDVGDNGYIVDLFNVSGGTVHDYAFRARGSTLMIDGIKTEVLNKAWTLAGLDYPDATYNTKGRSWGERILSSEKVRDLGLPGENIGPRGWVAPPGNGYGFLYDLRGGDIKGSWNAMWHMPDLSGIRAKFTMLSPEEGTLYRVFGPDKSGKKKYGTIIIRREDDDVISNFHGLIQAYEENPAVKAGKKLAGDESGSAIIRLDLDEKLRQGDRDYILYNSGAGGEIQATDEKTSLLLDGYVGHARLSKGEIQGMLLYGGHTLKVGDWQIGLEVPVYGGKVMEVNYHEPLVILDTKLPVGQSLKGSLCIFDSPGYSRNTAYIVDAVSKDGTEIRLNAANFDLGRSVAGKGTRSIILFLGPGAPLPTEIVYGTNSGYFNGKLVENLSTGDRTVIERFINTTTIRVTEPDKLQEGDFFVVRDIKEGDSFMLPGFLSVTRSGQRDFHWLIMATGDCYISPERQVSGHGPLMYLKDDGTWAQIDPENGIYRLSIADNPSGCWKVKFPKGKDKGGIFGLFGR